MTIENRRLSNWEILQGRNSKRGRAIVGAGQQNLNKARAGDKKARGKVVGNVQKAYLSQERVRNERRKVKAEKKDGILYQGDLFPITLKELSVLMDLSFAKGDLGLLSSYKRGVLQKLINDGKQWIIEEFAQ